MTSWWHSLPRRRRKQLSWAFGLLAFYTLFGFLVLPLIVRAVAVKQLSSQLNREVVIQSVRINPYALSTAIRGLQIKDPDAETLLSWDEVYVNFQLASFFGRHWVFDEISVTNPYVRVKMNKDYTFNFSDLIQKFSRGATPSGPSKPLALSVRQLRIGGARASIADLTPHQPFRRVIGPLQIALSDFHTDPDSQNPHSFTGSTDAGEVYSWSGSFSLNPVRAHGELSVANVVLNKYAALYQDLVRFEIRDGVGSFRGGYRVEWSATTNVLVITNAAMALRSFQLAEPGAAESLIQLPEFAVSGVNADGIARTAEIASLSVRGARANVRRSKDTAVNLIEIAKPSASATNAPGGILFLLRSVTNTFAALLQSTNVFTGSIRNLSVEDCALALEDDVNSRPARLMLDRISFSATNLSNVPGTNLTAALSLRWNTNGLIKADVSATLVPLSADVGLSLDQVELRQLDPYLEPFLNLFILGSKLGLDGRVRLQTDPGALPSVKFRGSSWLDDFASVDGERSEDLVKWNSLRFDGIEANLNPPTVSVEQVELRDAFARLAIETNRAINILTAMRHSNTTTPAAQPAADGKTHGPQGLKRATSELKEVLGGQTNAIAAANLPKIHVASVVITNAHLEYSDRSIIPNVLVALESVNGTITDISSDELRHAQVHVEGRVHRTGHIDIIGRLNPLHQQAASDFKVLFQDVDLNPTDPYAGKFLGYRLTRGKLSLDVTYSITERHLKGRNLVVLDHLTLGDKVISPDATKLPVKLGLALLKDRSGKIELDVPVEGNLDDPEFRLGGVIWHAVLNVFTKIVTSPFTALGSLFGGKGEEIQFQDFEPGHAELLAAAREKLDGLAKGLYERPGLQVEIEGNASPNADGPALRRSRLELLLSRQKWLGLRKSAQAATPPEQILLTPQERPIYIRQFYEARAATLAAPANQPAAKTRVHPSSKTPEKGATGLIRRTSPVEQAQVAADMEHRLLASIPITADDLQSLAAARATQVQQYLAQTGRIDADRLSQKQYSRGQFGTNGHRVYLRLE